MSKKPPFWFYGYDLPAENIDIVPANGRRRQAIAVDSVGGGPGEDWYATASEQELDQNRCMTFILRNGQGDDIGLRVIAAETAPVEVDSFAELDADGNTQGTQITSGNFAVANAESMASGRHRSARIARTQLVAQTLRQVGLAEHQISEVVAHVRRG